MKLKVWRSVLSEGYAEAARLKHCPLRGIECNGEKCAWWRGDLQGCAVWVGSGK